MTAARPMDHPSELVLAAYLDGTLDPEATDRNDRHVARCVRCRTLVRSARERMGATDVPVPPDLLARAGALGRTGGAWTDESSAAEPMASRAGRPDPGVSGAAAESRWKPSARWTLSVGAAAAAVALLATVLVVRFPIGGRGVLPAAPADARYRSSGEDPLTIRAPLPGASVAGPEVTFSWSAVGTADRYLVTVLDAGGAVVATIEARPPAHSAVFTPAPGPRPVTLLWRVRALELDRTLSETRPAAFELR